MKRDAFGRLAASGLAALLGLAGLTACEPAGRSITVRVVSGLRAGGDIDEVQARLFEGAGCSGASDLRRGQPLVQTDQESLASTGFTVGVFGPMRPGSYAILVAARRDGTTVVDRCTAFQLVEDRILLVGLTTSCVGVECPSAGGNPAFTECLNGRCVDPRCLTDDPATSALCCDREALGDTCESAPTLCASVADCPSAPVCAFEPACAQGLCVEPAGDRCDPGQYCSATSRACTAFSVRQDAGPSGDASLDALPSIDAPPIDAPPIDAPSIDAGLDAPPSLDAPAPVDVGADACVCAPGTLDTPVPCGRCGTQTRTCSADCTWGAYGACSGEGPCSPGSIDAPASCGRCGTRTRSCNADCTWGAYGACGGEGSCTPSARQTGPCGTCGTRSRTCRSDCTWGAWGACGGDVYCTDYFGAPVCPGDTGERGGCTAGCTRTCTCGASGSWGVPCDPCPGPPC